MKVSVVVPAFNEEKYIEKCLRSLSEQTLSRRDYEIIVVDGGSKDNTLKIANKYANKLLKNKKPIGAARQAGLKAAKAPVVAFIDADTTCEKTWLEIGLKEINKPQVVLVYGPFKLNSNLFFPIMKIVEAFFFTFLYTLSHTGLHNPVGFNMMIRKSQSHQVGGFKKDFRMLEDVELAARLKKLGKIVFCKNLLVKTSDRRVKDPLGLLNYPKSWFVYFFRGTTKNMNRTNVR